MNDDVAAMARWPFVIRASSLICHSSFVIRHLARDDLARSNGNGLKRRS
jgi:hypothetical protein